MSNDLISRSRLRKNMEFVCMGIMAGTEPYDAPLTEIDNAPTVESRMFYVQETVNTILNRCTGNTDIDKAFRNAARLVQNAIDGKAVDFEKIENERSEEE